jgi:hypothetical protein
VTRHPTAEWVVQQLREAFPEAGPYRYVILDRDAKFDGEVVAFLKSNSSETQADRHPITLAKWHRGALGGKLSTGVVEPRDPAERTTLEVPCSRLCGVLSGRPHSRRPRQRQTHSAASRKEAVCGGNSDFKRALGWSPSSLLMARSSLGGSLRWVLALAILPSSIEAAKAARVGPKVGLRGQRAQDPKRAGKPRVQASAAARSESAHTKPRRFLNSLQAANPILTTHNTPSRSFTLSQDQWDHSVAAPAGNRHG